jgi:hypothetical protein
VSIDDERCALTDVSHDRHSEAVVVDHGAEPLLDLSRESQKAGQVLRAGEACDHGCSLAQIRLVDRTVPGRLPLPGSRTQR